jgi:photosystem II stability/assembly factor-like uncharacterized protein
MRGLLKLRPLLTAFVVGYLILISSCNPTPKKSITSGCVVKHSSNSVDTLKSGSAKDILGINMFSTGMGYVSGKNGVILKTLNGGNNWFAQTSGTGSDLKSIYALDKDSAVAVGFGGIILRTKDKGSSWNPVASGTLQNLNSVFFPRRDTGYVCGNGGVILKTVNGGINWILQATGTLNNLYCVNFIGRDTGVVVGQNGTILQTINGGTNWSPKVSPIAIDLLGLDFIDSKAIAVGAFGKIIRTLDYGNTWDSVQSPTILTLNSIVWCQQKIAYAVGQNGVSLRYNGTSWTVGPQGTTNTLNFVHAPFWKHPGDTRLGSAWTVGEQGTILVLNPEPCSDGVISTAFSETCNWCLSLRLNNPSTVFTQFVFSASSSHLYSSCTEGDMNITGFTQYEQTEQITSFNIPAGSNTLEVKIYGFPSGTVFPVNLKFYLYNPVNDNSCYIELDDVMCCPDCSTGSSTGNISP